MGKRGTWKARGPVELGNVLDGLSAPAFKKRGFKEARLILEWPVIVGKTFAQQCVPERIVLPRNKNQGATLYIKAQEGFALELQHLVPVLLERIATFYGYAAIAQIKITQGLLPTEEKPAMGPKSPPRKKVGSQKAVEGIEDEALADSLKRLGELVCD